MKLDERILPGKRPLTCFDTEEARKFEGKEGYFSDYPRAFGYGEVPITKCATKSNLFDMFDVRFGKEDWQPFGVEDVSE